ncbi:unnamed protein product [Prunus brigantina]
MVEGAILVVHARKVRLRRQISEEMHNEVESLIFDLFANLGASEEQLDFPVLYASAKEGWASTTYTKDPPADARNMSRLLDAIISHVESILFFLLLAGLFIIRVGDRVHRLHHKDSGVEKIEEGKVVKLMKKKGTQMDLIDSAGAGDIVSMAGLASPSIGHTVANIEGMIAILDFPCVILHIKKTFNTHSHLKILNQIPQNQKSNQLGGDISFLLFPLLINNHARSVVLFNIFVPNVLYKTENGLKLELIEEVTIEVNEEHVGLVMEALSHR